MKLNQALDGRHKVRRGLHLFSSHDYSLDAIKYFFVFFWCFCTYNSSFGISAVASHYIEIIGSCFPAAIFIITGFQFFRRDDKLEEHLKNAIRTLIFMLMFSFAANLVCSVIYCISHGIDILTPLKSFGAWARFILLGHWPFDGGAGFWVIQGLLYSYLLMYFLKKRHLMRYDTLLAVICVILHLVLCELPAVFGITPFGLTSLRFSWFTFTLPCLLIGRIMRRKMRVLSKIPTYLYIVIAALLVELSIVERSVLSNAGLLVWDGFFLILLLGAFCLAFPACKYYHDNKENLIRVRTHAPEHALSLAPAAALLYYSIPFSSRISLFIMGAVPFAWLVAFFASRFIEKYFEYLLPGEIRKHHHHHSA